MSEQNATKISFLGRLTACFLNPRRWYDYLLLVLIGIFPMAWAKWIGAADSLDVSSEPDGLKFTGYWEKANAWALAFLLPLSLLLLRWGMNRIAAVYQAWPPDNEPPILHLVERENDKQTVYEALRKALLSPKNFIFTILVVGLIHVIDLTAEGGVVETFSHFPQEPRNVQAIRDIKEKDTMYLFLSRAAGPKATKQNCAILAAGFYISQFGVLFNGVLFITLVFRHNLFFLGRVYQRRWVPEGQARKYFRIDLDDVNKCFGFRKANDAFNTQVLILVVAGIGCLFSRYQNAKAYAEDNPLVLKEGATIWDASVEVFLNQKWFQDSGQILIGVIFVGAMIIFTIPSVVKLLPLIPVRGSKRAYHSITGFLHEYLSDEDWPYGDRPTESEINRLAGRFSQNAFWPTGDNRARRLFMFCFWVLFVMIVPLYFETGAVIAFLVVSGFLATVATALLFFAMRRCLAYIDDRLVKPPPPESMATDTRWHKERLDVSVFISYRRSDSAAYAGRLRENLANHIGEDRIFMDIEAIAAGTDFVNSINEALAKSDAVLVLIGDTWATTAREDGTPRLADPEDFVRLEVATALERGKEVYPILVGGAQMPDEGELPEALKGICRRNAIEITDTRWNYDVGRLVEGLRRLEQKTNR